MPRTSSKRLYLIFVHYGLKGQLKEGWVRRKLQADLRYLSLILRPRSRDKWEGHAFVFIDRGYPAVLRQRADMLAGLRLGGQLQQFLSAVRIPSRVTPVTAIQLIRLVERLGRDMTPQSLNSLNAFLTGDGGQLFYDGPKVVEAVLRIANIGRQTPLFRFDDDVIFYGSRARLSREDQLRKSRETTEEILRLCEHYDSLCRNSSINYFIFSRGYCNKDLSDNVQNGKCPPMTDATPLINGFATRVVHLANVANAHSSISSKAKVKELSGYSDERLDKELKKHKAEISSQTVAYFLQNLYVIGANPFRQVISGAGFCLSDSAILDLPPYSNMRQNIVWIDDHLKYALHHELRHFGFYAGTAQTARLRKAYFDQVRHPKAPTLGDVRWHVRVYLPRMILGCVADSWLRADRALKLPFRDLSRAQVNNLLQKMPGTYTRRFLDVVGSGWRSQEERKLFAETLWELALQRLDTIVRFFERSEFEGTFLKLFALGSSQSSPFGPVWRQLGFFSDFAPDGLESEIDRLRRNERPGPGTLQESLHLMVEDFIKYIEFVRFWRHFVFCVRSLLNWRTISDEDELWLLPGVVN